MKNIKFYSLITVLAIIAVVSVGYGVNALSGDRIFNISGDYVEAPSEPVGLGGVTSEDEYFSANVDIVGKLDVQGEVTMREATTVLTATSTLTALQSGNTFYMDFTNGATTTLPAIADGLVYRFVITSAFAANNMVINSAEGSNIEGSLIVAGAVVDCDAEHKLNFIADGENIGDYVELRSDGSQWLIGDSGVLTSGKLTCTN